MTPRAKVNVRRIYEDTGHDDGMRVLVDRLWPRGMSKERAGLDHWARDIAPSGRLRRWYGHRPERFPEFKRRYQDELVRHPANGALEALRDAAGSTTLTLLTATRNLELSAATVVAEMLRQGT
jgi:uncharacterized protein YeaO (DUF488 family)